MPRAIWSGSISFGLVNVPVRMVSAIDEQDLEFDLLHEKDGGRIGFQTVCKLEGEPVPRDELVKGYEVAKGEYVYMTEEDFAAAEVEGTRAIVVEGFVPYEDIDPVYFERTYYLAPEDGSERVYALFLRALERSGLAGIARYVMRDREHLACLRTREGAVTLERMYFADEVRPVDGVAPGDVEVDRRELEMATELIDRFAMEWDPAKYRDTYRERLLRVIEAKRKGTKVRVEAARAAEQPTDLMEALEASLAAARRGGGRVQEGRPRKQPSRRGSRKPAAR